MVIKQPFEEHASDAASFREMHPGKENDAGIIIVGILIQFLD